MYLEMTEGSREEDPGKDRSFMAELGDLRDNRPKHKVMVS
jgi:hypothetical protein